MAGCLVLGSSTPTGYPPGRKGCNHPSQSLHPLLTPPSSDPIPGTPEDPIPRLIILCFAPRPLLMRVLQPRIPLLYLTKPYSLPNTQVHQFTFPLPIHTWAFLSTSCHASWYLITNLLSLQDTEFLQSKNPASFWGRGQGLMQPRLASDFLCNQKWP